MAIHARLTDGVSERLLRLHEALSKVDERLTELEKKMTDLSPPVLGVADHDDPIEQIKRTPGYGDDDAEILFNGRSPLVRALSRALIRAGFWNIPEPPAGDFAVNTAESGPFMSALTVALARGGLNVHRHVTLVPDETDATKIAVRISPYALRAASAVMSQLILRNKVAAQEESSAYKYAGPFVARQHGKLLCCPGCGSPGYGEIPHNVLSDDGKTKEKRYAPRGWIARHRDGLLQCADCRGSYLKTEFADTHTYIERRDGTLLFEDSDGRAVSKEVLIEAVGQAAQIMDKQRSRTMTRERKTIKDQAKDLGGAATLGVAMAATNQSGEILVDMFKAIFANNPLVEAALEDPLVRELVKASMALVLYGAAENAPGVLPKSEAIAKIAKLQVTWSTAKLSNEQLAKLRPFLMKLAEVGESLPALSEGSENEVAEAVREDERERVPARR